MMRRCRKAMAEAIESRRYLAAGALDSTFSTDGIATPVPGLNVNSSGVQSTGKTIVAGFSTGGPAAWSGAFVVARYNTNGSLDTSFGTAGIALATFENYSPSLASATGMMVLPDDRIVVIGTGGTGISRVFVTRFTAEGFLDSSFSSDGIMQISSFDGASLGAYVSDVVVQNDGKLVVAGFGIPNQSGSQALFGVARINTNGTLDNTFDSDGTRYISFTDGFSYSASGVAIDYAGNSASNPNYGKIVVTGYELNPSTGSRRIAVARLTTGGSLDSSFDGDGRLLRSFGSGFTHTSSLGIVVQPTGKYVLACNGWVGDISTQDVGALRLNSNGSLDTTFGTAGQVVFDNGGADTIADIVIDPAGHVVLSGGNGGDMMVTCLSADGAPETLFGTNGVKRIDFPGTSANALSISVSTSNTLVCAGGQAGAAARLFARRSATISIGSFEPNASETGPDPATFIVGRLERLPETTRVYISTPGTATPPATFPVRPRDYDGAGISFGNGQTSSTFVDIPPNETFVVVTITPVDDTRIEADEYTTFTIAPNSAYDIGTPPNTTLLIHDNDFVGPPAVNVAQFLFQTGPQKLTFAFNQGVGGSLSDSDIVLTGPPGMPAHTFAFDATSNIATLTFDDILPDGNYSATVVAAGVTDPIGTPMAADYVYPFFFLNGDANRDRAVNFDDLLIVSQHYGEVGRTFSEGNFSYDALGAVGFEDLLIVSQRFGSSVLTNATAPAADRRAAMRRWAFEVETPIISGREVRNGRSLLDELA